jgi:2,3,4,5-tetrahydropyridine-2,6-dicarboxylate N-succinyltransferase
MTDQQFTEQLWDDRSLVRSSNVSTRVDRIIADLDTGVIRVASPDDTGSGKWITHDWIKKAILLYFSIRQMEPLDSGLFRYHDKIPLKTNFADSSVRVVPPAVARYGAYLAPGCILMPSYVNIGAYIGENTMIDTWATIGSCAQIGRDVHISGGVGIGGVLEPPQASPVIVEDGAFIGSRCIVVEGAHIGKQAVLGAGVIITGSSKIIDVTGPSPVESTGSIPARAVVIPGTYAKTFPSGIYQVPCSLIIGQRKASTDLKTSLNQALRENSVSV